MTIVCYLEVAVNTTLSCSSLMQYDGLTHNPPKLYTNIRAKFATAN